MYRLEWNTNDLPLHARGYMYLKTPADFYFVCKQYWTLTWFFFYKIICPDRMKSNTKTLNRHDYYGYHAWPYGVNSLICVTQYIPATLFRQRAMLGTHRKALYGIN